MMADDLCFRRDDPQVVDLKERGMRAVGCTSALDVSFMLAYSAQDFGCEAVYADKLEALARFVRLRSFSEVDAGIFRESLATSFSRRKPFEQYATEKARETIVKAFAANLDLAERRAHSDALAAAEAARMNVEVARRKELDVALGGDEEDKEMASVAGDQAKEVDASSAPEPEEPSKEA